MTEHGLPGDDIPHYDLLIIGGGINGAGIAREAAARGYSVCLCDADDFGSGTSSASTKLIHGGLRYLEHYEFRLVREALKEREILWQMAPHIIWPMRFVLPHHKGLRPSWLLRLGLFLYDHLGGRKYLPATRTLDLKKNEAGKVLKPEFKKGFEYSDCWVEDSRLVILNLRDAQRLGADLNPCTRVTQAIAINDQWDVHVETQTGQKRLTASMVINAAGPWVDEVLRTVFRVNDAKNVRLVRGSHIVVKKKFDHDQAYIFQNTDERILFAIPYERDFTLIGTTDVEQSSLPAKPEISKPEIDYLCEMANTYFAEPIQREDIIWTYSGVRPLYNDGASKAQEATRDYVIRTEKNAGNGRLINIFGGKITTYRRLAQAVMREVEKVLDDEPRTKVLSNALPGGDFSIHDFDDLVDEYVRQYSFLDRKIVYRLVRAYGKDAQVILREAGALKDLGEHFGHGLYEAEVRYLIKHEWAQGAEDILFRRSKLGIRMSADERQYLDQWLAKNA